MARKSYSEIVKECGNSLEVEKASKNLAKRGLLV